MAFLLSHCLLDIEALATTPLEVEKLREKFQS